MAITSEFIGSLQTPGFGFMVSSPGTYALPKFPYGAAIMSTRWDSSGKQSFDILDRETGEVVKSVNTSSYGSVIDSTNDGWHEAIKKGGLLRFNNRTEIYIFIIPNPRQTPPVWNG